MGVLINTTASELSLEQQLRIQAAVEDRPVSALIDDAIRSYLRRPEATLGKRLEFQSLLKDPPLKATPDMVRAILEIDYYEQ